MSERVEASLSAILARLSLTASLMIVSMRLFRSEPVMRGWVRELGSVKRMDEGATVSREPI